MIEAIVLAAGKGTRMRSALPKVLHPLAGKPLVKHVLETASHTGVERIHLVVGHGADSIKESLQGQSKVDFVTQNEQLGTAHAVMQALPCLTENSTTLILYGDVPLISSETLQRLLSHVSDQAMALLTATLPDPSGYGRILRDENDALFAIVEQKDATEEQLKITEVNTGVMAVKSAHLREWLPLIDNKNAQKEYYLTDIVELARSKGKRIEGVVAGNIHEIKGVNNRAQQAELERYYQQCTAQRLMAGGVTIMDPARFDCRGKLVAGEDCLIDVNCIFEGQVSLGNSVSIGPNCLIKNATILDGSVIHANTVIEDATIGQQCSVGPFARVRPGSVFAEGAKVGNFVETKKVKVGRGSKINHLSYVGDAELGNDVNIGAGTITCNYDGVNKHKTEIGDHVFVGSNTALVAPVKIDAGATIAAGSTITSDVNPEQLAVARSRQRNIDGWQRPSKK